MKYKILTIAFCLTATAAYSTSFNFSYVFTDSLHHPGQFSGTLTGTQAGDSTTGYVTGITLLSLTVNGVAIPGTLYNFDYNGDNTFGPEEAVVSFALNQNNFLFVNSDVAADDFDYTGFAEFHDLTYKANNGDHHGLGFSADRGDGIWTLTASVPDTSATLALLGGIFLGLAALRRRFVS